MNNKNYVGEQKKSATKRKMTVVEEIDKTHLMVEFDDGYQMTVTKNRWNNNSKTIKMPLDATVWGHGYIGIGKYKPTINGVKTPAYKCWADMLRRCYDEKRWKTWPAYKGSSVCDEWLCYNAFAAYYDKHFYQVPGARMELDKDLLSGCTSKVYCPENCCFLPQNLNKQIISFSKISGKYVGVHFDKKSGLFSIHCNNQNSLTWEGGYATPQEAFVAYCDIKEQGIKEVAELYKSYLPKNVYKALISFEVLAA